MNNLLDMLTKAGYEISSIGNDVLPCTLRLRDQPIGFLMDDLSVRLLPDREQELVRLQPVIAFAAENQGIEMDQGEYKLSQYRNVILTASFDYESCHPVYNIYSEDQNKEWTLLNSSEVKSVVTKDFVARSGLVSGEIPAPALEPDRVQRFMDDVREKGYQFRKSREESQRSYDITDQNGKEVGFIGRDNRVTITSEDSRVKRTLTNAYLDAGPDNKNLLPAFFEKLKNRLKEIGMALKVIFTPKGRHYAIQNQRQQGIASVDEKHEVTYTNSATAEEKARIDALVEELRRESQEKERPETAKEQEAAVPETKAAEVPGVSVTAEEIRHVAEAVLSDSAMAEVLFQTILSNPEFAARLNERIAGVTESVRSDRETPAAEVKQKVQEQTEKQPATESPAATKVRQEFERDYSYLQTLFGFNQEKYDALKADMAARFGTADPKEFQTLLKQGAFDRSDTLKGKLESSQRVAELRNSRAAAQREQTKEKERA